MINDNGQSHSIFSKGRNTLEFIYFEITFYKDKNRPYIIRHTWSTI